MDYQKSEWQIKRKIYEYNHCLPNEHEKIHKLIRDILGKAGADVHIEAPFYCDYGKNIEVGDNFLQITIVQF